MPGSSSQESVAPAAQVLVTVTYVVVVVVLLEADCQPVIVTVAVQVLLLLVVTAATGVYKHQSDGALVKLASIDERIELGSSENHAGGVVAVYDGQTLEVAVTVVTPGIVAQPVQDEVEVIVVVAGETGVYIHQSDGAAVRLASSEDATELGSSENHAGGVVAVYGGQTLEVVVAFVIHETVSQSQELLELVVVVADVVYLCLGYHDSWADPQDAEVVVVVVEGSQLSQLSARATPASAAAANATDFIFTSSSRFDCGCRYREKVQ